jgi:hypothetical protein
MTLLTTLLFGLALAAEPLPLNSATSDQLASLDGMDRPTADAVVALRAQRGRLSSVEELRILSEVSGTELDAIRRGTVMDFTIGATDSKRQFRTVDDVLTAFEHEPSIEELQQWAMHYSKTHPAAVEAWWNAARKGKLLPQFDISYRYDDDYGEDYNYVSDDLGDAIASLDGVNRDRDHSVLVRAKWDFDDLLMSSNHMRVISESRKQVEFRDEIMEAITGLYFERRRHQVEMLLSPSRDLKAQVEDQLKLMELTAQLDAYTGGRFSDGLAGPVE